MRLRLFVEIDMDPQFLVTQFGANLPNVTPQLPGTMAKAVGTVVQGMPGIKEVKVVTIPVVMSGDVVR
jgi:hypothetical protein